MLQRGGGAKKSSGPGNFTAGLHQHHHCSTPWHRGIAVCHHAVCTYVAVSAVRHVFGPAPLPIQRGLAWHAWSPLIHRAPPQLPHAHGRDGGRAYTLPRQAAAPPGTTAAGLGLSPPAEWHRGASPCMEEATQPRPKQPAASPEAPRGAQPIGAVPSRPPKGCRGAADARFAGQPRRMDGCMGLRIAPRRALPSLGGGSAGRCRGRFRGRRRRRCRGL